MTLAWTPAASSSPYRMQDARSRDDYDDGSPIGGAEVRTPDGRSLPFVSAKLRIVAGAGLARVVLEQTFENPFEEALRVTYKMPLPVDGAVSGYAFRVGGRSITGRVDRKETARARFEEAIATGRTAALLEEDKADIFTQEIGNIPPRRTIVAEITIDQPLAWRPEGAWELRFPTVIGPRYIEGHVSEADAKASHVEVAEGSESGGAGGVRARVHLEVKIDDALSPGRHVESPSHLVSARPDGVVELRDAAGAKLDRDIVLRWAVARRDVGLALRTARPEASLPHGRSAYGLLSIVPPAPDAGYAKVPRDLIVLLDTSGSMDGEPLAQAKRVVASLIDSLSEDDRLEVIEFSMAPKRYARSPVPGTRREKDKAIRWVVSRNAGGGTEMRSAVFDALSGLRRGAQRQVVLVTDGYVGGEEELVALLHENLPESCRMHVVGVGAGVNRTLATSIARAGRGAEVLVGPGEDAERSAAALVDKTRAPVLTDVTITGDALVEHAPEHVPDVFAGSPVVAALKLRPSGGEIVVRGHLAVGTWEQRLVVPAIEAGAGNQAVVALFGRERVADLEVAWTIGRETREIDREIEGIGLVFQIATRKTSWVAIDEDRSVDPRKGSVVAEIPQELPYGTSMASFGLAAPVTPAQAFAAMAPSGAMPIAAPRPMSMSIDSLREMAPPDAFEEESLLSHEGGAAYDADDEPTMASRPRLAGAPRAGGAPPPPPAPAPARPAASMPSFGGPPPSQEPDTLRPPAEAAPEEKAQEMKKAEERYGAPPPQASYQVEIRSKEQQVGGSPAPLAPKRRPLLWPALVLALFFLLVLVATLVWLFTR